MNSGNEQKQLIHLHSDHHSHIDGPWADVCIPTPSDRPGRISIYVDVNIKFCYLL